MTVEQNSTSVREPEDSSQITEMKVAGRLSGPVRQTVRETPN
jgi:hypothetical protein